MPVRKRRISNSVKSPARTEASPKTASIATVSSRMPRRPTRSASRPNTKAPTNMPRKNTVPICKAVTRSRPKLAATEGQAKPTAMTCIASAAQTIPKIASSRH